MVDTKQGYKKITVYLDPKDYQRMRANLVMEGKNMSSWVRSQIKKHLKSDKVQISP